MVTAEISIIPIGTCSTSISDFVAETRKITDKFPKVNTTLTAMGTELECDEIETLFEIMKEIHQAPFKKEVQRVYTVIKIDDRRDKKASLEDKVNSVTSKCCCKLKHD